MTEVTSALVLGGKLLICAGLLVGAMFIIAAIERRYDRMAEPARRKAPVVPIRGRDGQS